MNPKFRAWDKIQRKMGVVISNNWMTGVANIFIDNKETLRQEQDYILMKSTGIKDKNGTEIFEGDIIDYKGRKAVVKWHGSYASFIYIFIDELQKRKAEWKPLYLSYLKYEVVGNIYENKDLLEATND